MFCPKCGSILMPKVVNGKKVLACSCGYTDSDTSQASLTEKGKESQKIEVFEEGSENVHPIVKQECPKCHHTEARFWEVQTRAADEPPTKFFKCTACGHTWRDYS